VRDLVAAKVVQVKERIAELKRIELHLQKAQKQCNAALVGNCDAKCPVLNALGPGTRG